MTAKETVIDLIKGSRGMLAEGGSHNRVPQLWIEIPRV